MESNTADSNDFRKDPKLLYDFLTSEIEHIKSEGQRPGWTRWAIYGALATLFWGALEFIELKSIKYEYMPVYLIIIYIFEGILFLFNAFVQSNDGSDVKPLYTFSKDLLANNRITLFLMTLREFLILILIFHLPIEIPLWIKIVLFIGNLSNIIIYIRAIYYSLRKIPLSSNTKQSNSILDIFFGLLLIALFIYMIYDIINISISYNFLDLASIKLLLIAYGIFLLSFILSREKQNSGLLSIIIDIRRSLVLESCKYDELMERTKVAFFGLKIFHVFQDYITEYIRINDIIINLVDACIKAQNQMCDILKKDLITDEDYNNMLLLQNYIKYCVSEISKGNNSLEELKRKIDKRMKYVKKTAAEEDLKSISNIITEEMTKNYEKGESLVQKDIEIKNLLLKRTQG